jgi:hypothetical protein
MRPVGYLIQLRATIILFFGGFHSIFSSVNRLTQRQQAVVLMVLSVLLALWALEAHEVAHPKAAVVQPVKR